MVRWSDLISSVRHPRKGKCAKRREPYGRIGICEDLRHLRTASDCKQAQRQPRDQEFAVHLVLPSYVCCVKLKVLLPALFKMGTLPKPSSVIARASLSPVPST